MVVRREAGNTATVTASGGGGGGQQNLKKGPWTPAEDAILIEYVNKHGEGKWKLVPKNSGLQRCGKSCRLRWANHLRPNLKKGSFSVEEEIVIHQLHSLYGSKWSRIASQLPGRTDNEIKNYWNTKKKRWQRERDKSCSLEIQKKMDLTKFTEGFPASWTTTTPPAPATPTLMEGKPPLLYDAEPNQLSLFNSASFSQAKSPVGHLSQNSFRCLLHEPLLSPNASGSIQQESIGAKDLLPVPLANRTPAVASSGVLGNFELNTTPLPVPSPSCFVKMELPSSQVFSNLDDGEQNLTSTQGNAAFLDFLLHVYGVGKLLMDDLAMDPLVKFSDLDSSIGIQLNNEAAHDTSTLFDMIPAYSERYDDHNNSDGWHTSLLPEDNIGMEIPELSSILSMSRVDHDVDVGSYSRLTCPTSAEPFLAAAAAAAYLSYRY